MRTILVHPNPHAFSFKMARVGEVFHVEPQGLAWPLELRAKPPRIRLLEPGRNGWVLCEIVGEWPDAPDYWPPAWAPGAQYDPNWGPQPSNDFRLKGGL